MLVSRCHVRLHDSFHDLHDFHFTLILLTHAMHASLLCDNSASRAPAAGTTRVTPGAGIGDDIHSRSMLPPKMQHAKGKQTTSYLSPMSMVVSTHPCQRQLAWRGREKRRRENKGLTSRPIPKLNFSPEHGAN